MHLHAVPGPGRARCEHRRDSLHPPQPAHVRKVVILRRQQDPRRIGARRRVEHQIVLHRPPARPAPHVREGGLLEVRPRKDEPSRHLVRVGGQLPPRRVAEIEAPVDIAIQGRPAVDRRPVAGRRPAERQVERADRDVSRGELHSHPIGAAPAHPRDPRELPARIVVLEVPAQPILLKIVTPEPRRGRLRAFARACRRRRGRRGRWGWPYRGGFLSWQACHQRGGEGEPLPPLSAAGPESHRWAPRCSCEK